MKYLDYEDYDITRDGRVISYKGKTPRELKQSLRGDYFRVELSKNGIGTTFPIHRLVAECFIPNPENKPQVNHIDGNKQNNRSTNFEWNTPKENTNHAMEIGLRPTKRAYIKPGHCFGENVGSSKLNDKKVLEIISKYVPRKYSSRKLGKEYGVHQSIILDIIHNKTWKHIKRDSTSPPLLNK